MSARSGIGGSVLAVVRGLAFFGLMLAGLALLAIPVGALVLTVLGFEGFIQFSGPGNTDTQRNLIATVIGLAAIRFLVPGALLAIRRLAMLTRRLAGEWCGVPIAAAYKQPPPATRRGRLTGTVRLRYRQRMGWLLGDAGTWRDMLWLAVSACAGPILLLAPAALVTVGVYFLLPTITHVVPPPAFPGNTKPVLITISVAFTALGLWIAPLMLRGYAGLARLTLEPSGQAELEMRVMHLARTREETLDTGAAELRRIERDLHDGAQARLVAMGLTLDAAGRLIDNDPKAARALLLEARDASAKALSELRDLVRGIHPPVLADRGLVDAIRALALDSPLRVRVTGELPGRAPAPVESAAYFAVSELLANVAKHAGAPGAEVDLRHALGALRISVADNGAGGADPARGTGLRGIERRLAAFDGVLAVSSPVGGPTVITMELPCALS
ncbi:MAG TPA: histidine kinase [Trebonia sp.]